MYYYIISFHLLEKKIKIKTKTRTKVPELGFMRTYEVRTSLAHGQLYLLVHRLNLSQFSIIMFYN